MNVLPSELKCPIHGPAYETYICEHLLENPAQKWHSNEPDEANRWPDAWCQKCEAEFLRFGEWNEQNEGAINIELVCHNCYERARSESTSSD